MCQLSTLRRQRHLWNPRRTAYVVASVGQRRSQQMLLLAREIDKALIGSASTLAVHKSKLSPQQVTAFQSEIAGLVSVQTGCVNWRNPRTPAFAYWADFNTDPWCLHAHWTGGSGPRFIGIMISVHPSHSNAVKRHAVLLRRLPRPEVRADQRHEDEARPQRKAWTESARLVWRGCHAALVTRRGEFLHASRQKRFQPDSCGKPWNRRQVQRVLKRVE